MKNLMVFASALMIGAAAFAGNVPRVYQYTASLNTAVAKNAKKVTFKWDGEKVTFTDICYRTKGKVTFKGIIVYGCDCVPDDPLAAGYPLMLLTSSEDKYKTLYVYVDGQVDEDNWWPNFIWGENEIPQGLGAWALDYSLIGNALPWNAKVAETSFFADLYTGDPEGCGRLWFLEHQGFGKAAIIDRTDNTLELSSVSGNVTGSALAPYCSADQNNCPRCEADDECAYAIGFAPCFDEDELEALDLDDDQDLVMQALADGGFLARDWGIAYGTFSLKYNKTYSNAIRDFDEADLVGTVEALTIKAFKQIKSEDQVEAFYPIDPDGEEEEEEEEEENP